MTQLEIQAQYRWLALAMTGLALMLALAPTLGLAADPVAPATATKPAAATAAKPSAKVSDAKPREGSLGKGSGPLLTREQLRLCMAEQERLKQEGAAAATNQGVLSKDRVEIDRLGTELEADKSSLDRTSQSAVDGYNERARARDKLAADYVAAAKAFNQRLDKLDLEKETFKKDCADRKYFEDDYDAIKAGK